MQPRGADPSTATLTPPAAVLPAGAPARFGRGDLVAGRYRVVGFLARGASGEVYEAVDQELLERVALKVLRAEVAGAATDAAARERFKREIQLARRVTHRSVSRIFEFGIHEEPEGGEPVWFLSMELLEGETLGRHLAREGPLLPAQALPLVRQMAAALGAAHEVGVVHRDFKSDNVMLVPGATGLRAIVTDFGLARAAGPGRAAVQSGLCYGSPATMAPEQVEGGAVSARTDLYALGVVLFEMVTGRPPFEAETPIATALARLERPAPSPRERVPDLDARWEAAILRCLAREPAKRFASAAELVAVLEGLAPLRPRRRPGRVGLALAVALLCAGALGAVGRWRQRAPSAQRGAAQAAAIPEPPPPGAGRPGIAVLAPRDLGERAESAWLATALREMLQSELGEGAELRTVPAESVARVELELGAQPAGGPDAPTRARLLASLGAELVLFGTYREGARPDRPISVHLAVAETRSGRLRAEVSDSGSESQLIELGARLGARLRQRLGAAGAGAAARPTLPRSTEAARLYAEGLARLRRFDSLGARTLLEQASGRDPEAPLVHAALADALFALGREAESSREATRAHELARGLPRAEELLVEGRYQQALGRYAEAEKAYGALFRLFPEEIEYGLRLGHAAIAGGRARAADETLLRLRRASPAAAQDPRIDLLEAEVAHALGEHVRQRLVAARATARARAQGARLLGAAARASEGQALASLGEPDQARAAYEEAQGLFDQAGDRAASARVSNSLARLAVAQGDLDGARRRFEQVLATSRELGDRPAEAEAQNNLANVLLSKGDLDGARQRYAEALTLQRELGDPAGVATTLKNLAFVLRRKGDLSGARLLYEEALATEPSARSAARP